ncbi:MAG: 4-hydroxy-3-methylbut-2-enyl diphosphate reductase [Cyclobacteriaceae bacterium]|nr:4-hydroxy-3-methylbut-2-enyl diphosphate reductase [Cyclobacteriaceae bacterium]
MTIDIDHKSGYCFGVEFAIQMAEDELDEEGALYCLGDIVHNGMEVERLAAKGLKVIDHKELAELHDCKVLIRAHGEPPETYKLALKNNIELIDASCPVVLKLQNRVRNAHQKVKKEEGQTVIYGKQGHAEVVGLTGQTANEAIVVMNDEDLDQVDFTKPITLFSQTTKSTKGFGKLVGKIKSKIADTAPEMEEEFNINDSICRQVSNRDPHLEVFAQNHDVIVFVSGKKSSNGKALFQTCKANNERSYFIESETELEADWFSTDDKVGICGATSTPNWLMEQVKEALGKIE